MKNYSLNPTNENALSMFRNDTIGRNREIARFIQLLDAIEGGCSIALNGDWGSGKTFFVKQVKLILDYCNPQTHMSNKTRESLKQIISSFGCDSSESNATVYYDAWANDNTEDPILSLIYATIKSNQTDMKEERKIEIANIVSTIVDLLTGLNTSKFVEQVKKFKGKDLFEAIKEKGNIDQLVKRFINILIEERGNKLIFFIDELDRCKPDYAIKMLERIKHYFDDERIIFVFSVNLQQLQHTIKAYYGAEFDATRYMDKFFDLRVSLSAIDYDSYFNNCAFFKRTSFFCDHACEDVIRYFRFTLREIERYIRLVKIAINKKSSYGFFNNDTLYILAGTYFVPVAIGLSMKNLDAYSKYINGLDPYPIAELPSHTQNKI